jgi:hypothetical protein
MDIGMTMRSPRLARPCLLIIALAGVWLPALDVFAQGQAPGNIPDEILQASSSLSSQQVTVVETFASRGIEDLASGNPAEVVRARDGLIEPTRLRTSPVFLRAYADILLPAITPLVSEKETMRAENALRVAAFLRTPEAAELLISSSDPDSIKDVGVRLVAAGLLVETVQGDRQSAIPATTLVSIARSISTNVARETDWLIALEDLRAMQAIVRHPEMSDQSRKVAREILFDAFSELGARIEASPSPSPLINAVYRAVSDLRSQIAQGGNRNDFDAGRITAALREMILHVARSAATHWDVLTDDLPTFQAYAITLTAGSQVYDVFDSSSQGSPLSRLDDPMNAYLEAVETLPTMRSRLVELTNSGSTPSRELDNLKTRIADAEKTIAEGVKPLNDALAAVK